MLKFEIHHCENKLLRAKFRIRIKVQIHQHGQKRAFSSPNDEVCTIARVGATATHHATSRHPMFQDHASRGLGVLGISIIIKLLVTWLISLSQT